MPPNQLHTTLAKRNETSMQITTKGNVQSFIDTEQNCVSSIALPFHLLALSLLLKNRGAVQLCQRCLWLKGVMTMQQRFDKAASQGEVDVWDLIYTTPHLHHCCALCHKHRMRNVPEAWRSNVQARGIQCIGCCSFDQLNLVLAETNQYGVVIYQISPINCEMCEWNVK